jgi:hypothetical protein
MEMIA